jgi:Flp pilus assembly pilin Flp
MLRGATNTHLSAKGITVSARYTLSPSNATAIKYAMIVALISLAVVGAIALMANGIG